MRCVREEKEKISNSGCIDSNAQSTGSDDAVLCVNQVAVITQGPFTAITNSNLSKARF